MKTKVYYVQTGGFDTHANQVDTTDTSVGYHASLLGGISSAIKAFQDDLMALKADHRVVGMTFSEFGRRVGSNASRGTDHGSAAPLLVFGAGIRQQMIGQNANLSDLVGGNLKMQTDFRQVYSALLGDWLGEGQTTATRVLTHAFDPVPIFQSPTQKPGSSDIVLGLYPNPATDYVLVESAGIQSVQLISQAGGRLTVPTRQVDEQTVSLMVGDLPAGVYVVAVQTTERQLSNRLVITR